MNEAPDLYRIERRFCWCRTLAWMLTVHAMVFALVHTQVSLHVRRVLAVIPLGLTVLCVICAHAAYTELSKLVVFHEYLSSKVPMIVLKLPVRTQVCWEDTEPPKVDPSTLN